MPSFHGACGPRRSYVNDAFAVCHRNHASVYVVPRKFSAEHRGAGLLMERELAGLAHLVNSPERPFIAVFGGAKVADKLGAISALAGRADEILIGGLAAFPFLAASGHSVGDTPFDGTLIDVAREVLHRAGKTLVLPRDHVIAHKTGIQPDEVADEIPKHWLGLDIGPVTRAQFAEKIHSARTVVWNGPMGRIEHDVFLEGTRSVAEAMANSAAQIIVGGGETGAVVRRLGFDAQFSHISTGGGAFLSYIAHGTLPALEVLKRD